MTQPSVRLDDLRRRLAAHDQDHVLRWWDELTAAERDELIEQLSAIDLAEIARLYREADAPTQVSLEALAPAPIHRLPRSPDELERWNRARRLGESLLRAGQVAVLLVAGGQGTRLGFDGPKGTFPIGPISRKSLFQIHAEKVLALRRRYGKPVPLLVMTSPDNDLATREYFAAHNHFGLPTDELIFFCQGTYPALDRTTGKLLLAGKGRLATSPDGHGGVLRALVRGGHLANLRARGIRLLFYFQVDNPLVAVADPVMIGHHVESESEVSLKVVAKAGPLERVGNVVRLEGRLHVIEYSDLPHDLAHVRDERGALRIWAGSIGIHLFSIDFLERLADRRDALPFHRAVKKVPHLDPSGRGVDPSEPNAIKFERFIFDAFPLAERAVVLETAREVEFEPVKNAEGENSPATAQQAMVRLHADWLAELGVVVPRRHDNHPHHPIEISPLLALDVDELRERLLAPPVITGPTYLE